MARVDYVSAWIVALLAYGLYIGQAISRVQFANFLQVDTFDWLVFGLLMSGGLALIASFLWRWYIVRDLDLWRIVLLSVFFAAYGSLIVWLAYQAYTPSGRQVIPSLIGGVIGVAVIGRLQRPWRLRRSITKSAA